MDDRLHYVLMIDCHGRRHGLPRERPRVTMGETLIDSGRFYPANAKVPRGRPGPSGGGYREADGFRREAASTGWRSRQPGQRQNWRLRRIGPHCAIPAHTRLTVDIGQGVLF